MGLGLGAALILGGAGIGGSLISAKASKDEARSQRRYQMSVSSSAHQREVEDLRAAGLNPILSAGGTGASTPGGAMPSIPDIGSSVTGGVNAATALNKMKADVRNTTAIAKLNEADAKIAGDMVKTYNSNSAIKETVIGGMLGKKAGLEGKIGGKLGASVGAVKGTYDKYFKKPAQPAGPYKLPKPTKQNPWPEFDFISDKFMPQN